MNMLHRDEKNQNLQASVQTKGYVDKMIHKNTRNSAVF